MVMLFNRLFMFVFPMKAKFYCLVMAGIYVYMGIFSQGDKAAAICHFNHSSTEVFRFKIS